MKLFSDEYFMNMALKEAKNAYEEQEVPVGAIVVSQKQIIAKAYNQTEKLNDATAHAEILAITSAMSYLGNKYLNDCTLYVTLEPCVMCAGALKWSQIGKIVFASEDLKHGFMRYGKEILHPKTKLEYGVLQQPCSAILSHFFKGKRNLV
ncbi:MAG: nucleoside deaminase [Saprospiraceae bacterium]